MEVKEVITEKKENQYILTQKEYDLLLVAGEDRIKGYIGFCIRNYRLMLNYYGAIQFMEDMIEFIKGNKDYIQNTYSYSYKKYLEKCKNFET